MHPLSNKKPFESKRYNAISLPMVSNSLLKINEKYALLVTHSRSKNLLNIFLRLLD